jgi:hypothetical protein
MRKNRKIAKRKSTVERRQADPDLRRADRADRTDRRDRSQDRHRRPQDRQAVFMPNDEVLLNTWIENHRTLTATVRFGSVFLSLR